MHDLLIHTRTDTHIHTANCHYSKVRLCCASPVDCWCFPHLWKENKYMHAAPVFPALPGRYAAAARPLLGLIHMHTHTYSQTPTQHTHAYKGVGGGGGEWAPNIAIKAFSLACHPHFSSLTIIMMNSGLPCERKRRKRIRREEKLNCFLWPQDPNWALEHYRATYTVDHMQSPTHMWAGTITDTSLSEYVVR